MTEQREPWIKFLLKALLLSLSIVLVFVWIESRFRIGIDGQTVRCLPDHKYYLVDMDDKEVSRNKILAYSSKGLQPYYDDGTMMAKIVHGVPGDKVVVDKRGVVINGSVVAEGFALSQRLGAQQESFYRSLVIPEGKYLMLAPAPESYDGRYWGLIDESQVVGGVTPLL